MIRPIVLCKAPICGQVKTRLSPPLSAQQACDIHQQMAQCFIYRVHLWYPQAWLAVDEPDHPFFRQFNMRVVAQGDGDLGQRMQRLMALNIQSGMTKSLFLGTDSPHISRHRLHAACAILVTKQLAFAPVEDGGYQMIAIKGNQPSIFSKIPWGTSQVMNESLKQAAKLQLSFKLLSTSFDVDRVEDLKRLMASEHLFKFARMIW